MTIGRDVKRFMVVQHFQDVRCRWSIDDRGGDDLIHCFVVRGFGRVMYKACTAAIDGTGEEGHTERFLVGDTLKSTDEVGAFKVLKDGSLAPPVLQS